MPLFCYYLCVSIYFSELPSRNIINVFIDFKKRMAEKMLTLIEELTRLRACLELAEGALESAAKTAHYRQNNFCNGDFEDCVNCGKWRKALSEAEKNMGVK